MRNYRFAAAPTYFVALLLILFPLLEATLSVWPLRWGNESWRFGAVGQFSRALMSPMLGLLLAFLAAFLLEHRWVQYAIVGLSGIAAAFLGTAAAVFSLDALQLRSIVAPEGKFAFEVAALVAFGKCLIVFALALTFAFVGWRNLQQASNAAVRVARRDRKSVGLISRRSVPSESLPSAD